ncbi:MAG: hypothetical protein HC786_29250 [Richelia sp. CSU_2_1]|nr:hypothetical protein [Microcoleus sp. SU_5_6]NJR25913.1 hypothetical protein [Richelia sp. CSU_2_1]
MFYSTTCCIKEGRRKKEEGRRKKEEGRGKREKLFCYSLKPFNLKLFFHFFLN